MEPTSEWKNDPWVDERMAALAPQGEWRMDTGGAIDRFRQGTMRRPGRSWPVVAAGAVAGGLCLMAFPAGRTLAQRCVDCTVAVWQAFRPVYLSDRKAAPDFTRAGASGEPVRLADLRGKVVLLNFWAPWCPPCKLEMPWFVEFQNTYGSQGFVVLGVSLDEKGWETVRPFMASVGVNFPMVVGDDALAALYGGVQSLPTTMIIDRDGRIAATYSGVAGKAVYRAAIEKQLAEGLR